VIYLGPSLPPAEVAGAAERNNAVAVALSIVYPNDDPSLPAELEALRSHLPARVAIIAGGRAAPAYTDTLKKIDALQPASLQELYNDLNRLRTIERNQNQ
jgi:methylmalonyl-CoA mutase cobalamin-binding subunit